MPKICKFYLRKDYQKLLMIVMKNRSILRLYAWSFTRSTLIGRIWNQMRHSWTAPLLMSMKSSILSGIHGGSGTNTRIRFCWGCMSNINEKTYLGLDTIKVAKQLENSSKYFPKISWRFTQDFLEIYPRFTEGLP